MIKKLPLGSIKTMPKRQSGFTLIEAIVSLMLLAVMSVMSYQAVEVILGANERSRSTLANEAQMHRAWQIINRDLFHLRPRVFADGLGSKEPAYVTDPDQFGLRFSRGGGPLMGSNPTGVARIEYSLNSDDQLERRSWPVTGTSLNNDGNLIVLLDNVDSVEIEQLSRGGLFVPDWPPINESHSPLSLPRMIRITIVMLDGSETNRLIPGLNFDPRAGRNNSGSGSSNSDDLDDENFEDEDENEDEDGEEDLEGEDSESGDEGDEGDE